MQAGISRAKHQMENVIQLREVIDSDLLIFFEQQNDPVANQLAAFPARNKDAFMAHWAKIRTNESGIIRTILHQGEVAGNIVSFDMEGKREVGYWLGRNYWGKGIATQALSQFLGIERTRPLYGYVVRHNKGSQRVLEKCGFVFFGEDKEDFIYQLK